MEGNKQIVSSSSSSSPSYSLANDLFGSTESSSTSGIFGSMFAPTSKVLRRESIRPPLYSRKPHSSTTEACKTKPETLGNATKNSEAENESWPKEEEISEEYRNQRIPQPCPCHLSSSIYYGGQDILHLPEETNNPNTLFNQDVTEDDSGAASRGNWWQGSLYY